MTFILPTSPEGLIEDVPVDWLVSHLDMSVDGYTLFDCGMEGDDSCWCGEPGYDQHKPEGINWERLMEEKGADSTMIPLRQSIRTNGFVVPICVYKPWYAETYIGLGNGHHRITVAIQDNIETIPVYWTASGEYMALTHTSPDDIEW